MATKRKRNRRGQRNITTIARPRRSVLIKVPKLTLVEDRRTFYPSIVRAALTMSGKPAATRATNQHKKILPYGIGFNDHKRVLVCMRRKARRSTLFALRRTGKGSKAKSRRRSYYSSISCKR